MRKSSEPSVMSNAMEFELGVGASRLRTSLSLGILQFALLYALEFDASLSLAGCVHYHCEHGIGMTVSKVF